MSKFNIYADEYDCLASDRLVENAEAMLVLLKHMAVTTNREDLSHLIDRAKAITQHIETGE
jgi:C4-dicarboxylate-specific signal transduction histidine kinase